MDISYRRIPPRLLERAFARVVNHHTAPADPAVRVDIVHGTELELTPA